VVENAPDLTLSSVNESIVVEGFVQSIDSVVSDETITESFTLIKGSGIFYISFKTIPIWLAILSPLHFNYLCFIQFTSIQQLK